ncbi:MAG: hypothetical protein D6784_00410 [Chloroflexi bacterium]|nr:MAG: hypothetical protein D6784_00410 [Chloroflexota bacterium]
MKRFFFLAGWLTMTGLILLNSDAPALRALAYTLAGTFTLAAVGMVLIALLYAVERLRILRAERIARENQAHVTIVTDNGETWVRDTDRRATWRNLTGTPALRVNGKDAPISDLELELYRLRLLAQASRTAGRLAEVAQPVLQPAPVDLLAALDSVQRGLIVGPSDAGKTTLLQWIISRRLSNSRVVVIDPHAWPGKWPGGCTVIGTGRNYSEIDRALTGLVQLMTKRYDEIGRGLVAEMAHRRITVVIDEWRAIVQNVKTASDCIKTLLTESRKAAFTVFVASHSERVRALGIEGEGDLKDGFAVVRLAVVNGERTATLDTGDGAQPARLPGPFPAVPGRIVEQAKSGAQDTRPESEALDLTPEPDEQEAKILELAEAGASLNEIARQVFGSAGGKQSARIKAVLSRYA